MTTYKDVLLKREQNFAIHTQEGWIMGKVDEYEDAPIDYLEIGAMAAAATTHTISGGAAAGFNAWLLASGNDPFYEWEDKVEQCFVGLAPAGVRMWRQIPDGTTRGGLSKEKPTTLGADAIGFIRGSDSPYSDPQDVSELLLPPQVNLKFGLYNPEPFAIAPKAFIFVRRIAPTYFDPRTAEGRAKIQSIFAGERCHKWGPSLAPTGFSTGDSKVKEYAVPKWGVV